MGFELTAAQEIKAKAWMEEQDKKVALQQARAKAYYGPCGGGFTYHFTPTSIGMIIIISNCITKEELDLSEYEDF